MAENGTDLAILGLRLSELMGLVYRRMTGRMLQLTHEENLTLAQMVTLQLLAQVGAVPVGAIGEHLCLSTSATSSLVDQLVVRGLLDRREDPNDRRKRLVGVSEGGRELTDRLGVIEIEEMQAAIAGVSPELRPHLIEILDEAIAVLRAAEPPKR